MFGFRRASASSHPVNSLLLLSKMYSCNEAKRVHIFNNKTVVSKAVDHVLVDNEHVGGSGSFY